jgi:outer membrane lipoprotein SlyB
MFHQPLRFFDMNSFSRSLVLVSAVALMLSACGRNMGGDVYSSDSSVGKVLYGTVVSARTVTIKDKESNKEPGVGAIAGGVAGGVAGSTVGGGTGSALSAIGGALAGAVLGNLAEDQLSTQSGMEYIVQLDAPKTPKTIAKRSDERLTVNRGNSVESEVMSAAMPEESASDTISVLQQDTTPIGVGTRVMVVYRDDRARIVPAAR